MLKDQQGLNYRPTMTLKKITHYLLLLHGYGSGANETIFYLEADLLQAQAEYITLAPEGTINTEGRRFWNATPECCGPAEPSVNDSAYLQSLIAQAKDQYSVDPAKIYVIGISNGGFMAYRLACDTKGLLRGIVSIAGTMFADTSTCQNKDPISVLQIHGTRDKVIPFADIGQRYPGARASAEFWATNNECQSFVEEKNKN
ncbi:MAG: alpha/beta hydrolase family esterase [Oligoflexus sp.]